MSHFNNNGGQRGGGSRGSGGGFRGSGGRDRFGGRSGDGRFSGGHGRGGPSSSEECVYDICPHHARSRNCRFGDKCRNAHLITTAFSVPAHDASISTLALFNTPDAPAPKIISGSGDNKVKVSRAK